MVAMAVRAMKLCLAVLCVRQGHWMAHPPQRLELRRCCRLCRPCAKTDASPASLQRYTFVLAAPRLHCAAACRMRSAQQLAAARRSAWRWQASSTPTSPSGRARTSRVLSWRAWPNSTRPTAMRQCCCCARRSRASRMRAWRPRSQRRRSSIWHTFVACCRGKVARWTAPPRPSASWAHRHRHPQRWQERLQRV